MWRPAYFTKSAGEGCFRAELSSSTENEQNRRPDDAMHCFQPRTGQGRGWDTGAAYRKVVQVLVEVREALSWVMATRLTQLPALV